MTPAFVLQTLAEARRRLGADAFVVEEAPSMRPVMQDYLPFTRCGSFLTMESGGLGYGMPAAIGVALARPGRKVIALIGDGSAMYSPQALWNAVRMQLPIAFVIMNNARYAAVREFAQVFGFAPGEAVQGTELAGLDFVTLAAGMGCAGMRVDDPARLAEAFTQALTATAPILLEIIVR
jgi:benzoylformate decarboxylase